ncbi:MAG: ATP-grasp domain-containing protein [Candidatus Cloacimonetes bacterium]|nr:ATP-grasp domain-containing protein [Candidatus Cloacimonadota bacterium]
MKKIMILGAGVYQVPLIKTAKRMGLKSIVVSYKGNYPGFAFADEIEYIDIRDTEKVLEAARRHGIGGICTTGSDVGVKTIGFVNDAMSLCGVSYSAALLANNKYEMKQAFIRNEARSAKGIKVESETEALSAFKDLGSNVVFKTVDSSGNRGIIHIQDECLVENAFHECLSYSQCKYIMVEEFLQGEEIGAEAFISEGKVAFVLPHRKDVIETNAPIPIGQWVPAGLDEETERDVEKQVLSGISALGLDNCAVNVDIMIIDNKGYLIEIGARAGGGACLPESVSAYYGFNHYENIVNAALGIPIVLKFATPAPNACRMLFSEKEGIIKRLNKRKAIHPDLIELSFDYKIGDLVPKFVNKTHRIGHVIVKGSSAEEARHNLRELIRSIDIVIG